MIGCMNCWNNSPTLNHENQSVSGGYNFVETNSLLMESGEKYVVLISQQSVEFFGHGEHSSGLVHVFRCV